MRSCHFFLLSVPLVLSCNGKDAPDDDGAGSDGPETIVIDDPSGICGRYAFGQYDEVWKDFGRSDDNQINTFEGGWSEGYTHDYDDGIGSLYTRFACRDEGIVMTGVESYSSSEVGMGSSTTTYSPEFLIWRHDAGVGTEWTSTAVPNIESEYEDYTSGEEGGSTSVGEDYERSYKVVGESTLELPAGLFHIYVLEITESDRVTYRWISEGLGVVGSSSDPEPDLETAGTVLEDYGVE